MKRILSLLIFTVAFLQAARSEEIRLTVDISWEEPVLFSGPGSEGSEAWLPSFRGAVNHGQTGLLPVYFIQLPLDGTGYILEMSVENALSEALMLPDSLHGLAGSEYIQDDWLILRETVITRKKPWLELYLLPLRKDMATGEYHRLLSCELVLKTDPSRSSSPERQNAIEPTMNSVLREGDWYKLSVDRAGIYRIGYEDLQDYGIDPLAIDPLHLRLFGNGGSMLNESTSQPRPDDLIENSIRVFGEEDGRFDKDDFILFYAEGPVRWSYNPFYQQFEHEVNIYTDKVYYFLNVGEEPGKRIQTVSAVPGQANVEISTTNDFAYHERDSLNLIKSGKEWYGEVFHYQTSYDLEFSFPHLVADSSAFFKANFVARSTESSNFTILYEGEYLGDQEIGSVQVGSAIFARTMTTRILEFTPVDGTMQFTIDYDKPNNTSTGWLNYIEINALSHLVFPGGQMTFRNVASVGLGNISQFNISTSITGMTVWDITDPYHCRMEETFDVSGGKAIRVMTDTLREFLAFDRTSYYSPVFEKKVENQNLHGLHPSNMVIIVHPPFMEEALRLADFHRQHSRLTVNVVTPEQIYNEFSSGAQDISAVRDFLKMLYDRSDDEGELRYLLLFGDASYDYKDRLPEDNNFIPTFQSKESLKQASSFLTDDFFGCLDYGEGSNAAGTVDIGIGRFPVRNLGEARTMVDKVIHYASSSLVLTQPWRNSICLVADDQDNNTHLNQAEELAEIIETQGSGFNVGKIYLDAYLQQNSPVGERYPEASEAINHSVTQGALLVNYTGHGGETGWAHEKVLDMPMILGWKNHDRLPAFVTATCEFSRFDDPGLVSAGELVVLNPEGGGIGLFTTTRLAYSQSNVALNKRFYQAAFVRDSVTGEYPRMGDLMRAAKTPSSQNIKNFVLLGDPALMLAYPYQVVKTLTINNEYTGKETDTLRALSYVTITGQVEDIHGNRQVGFQGIVYPVVYDKPVTYQTRGNDNDSKVTDFPIQNKVLFKGEATVTDGEFSFSFIVPRDISYQIGLGKISYYAVDTNTFVDAQGYTRVLIGGSDDQSVTDDQGPVIELYLNDTTFRSGDFTTSSPVLLARLFDESGINTVGNGIGHDIAAVLDGYTQNPIVLNEHYTPDPDTYRSGWVTYPLGRMSVGTHTLSLKAWDIYNNSSEVTVTFVIDTVAPLYLTRVYNYPNPFRDLTRFVFSHNKPGSAFDVAIDIFSVDGRYVQTLEYSFTAENLESPALPWDGRDKSGRPLDSGMYIYRVKVISDNGRAASVSQKLIIVR